MARCCSQGKSYTGSSMHKHIENNILSFGVCYVSFHSNTKERQCQRRLKLPHSCILLSSVQFNHSVVYGSLNCIMPGLPVHHQLPEFIQTHVHRVSDAIQPSHPLSSPSPPAPNPSQHQWYLSLQCPPPLKTTLLTQKRQMRSCYSGTKHSTDTFFFTQH